eukprot:PhM_4_TR9280/c0_g1_i1/m.101394
MYSDMKFVVLVSLFVSCCLCLSANGASSNDNDHDNNNNIGNNFFDRYCNAPLPKHLGVPPIGMHKQVVQVHYLHRHGDRAPSNAVPQYMSMPHVTFNCSLDVMQSVNVAGPKFRIATPPETSSYFGNCQLGQLTPLGGQQLFAVGTALRDLYGAAVLNPATSFVQVTGDPRTHRSAAALMDGAFGGDKTTRRAVVPFAQCDGDREPLWQPHHCPSFPPLVEKITSQRRFTEFQNTVVLPVVSEIAAAMNVTIADAWLMYNNSIDVWGALYCHDLGSEVPLDLRLRAVNLSQTYAYMMYTDHSLSSWSAAPFVNAVVPFLQSLLLSSEDQSGHTHARSTFVEWSGHDGTVQAVLAGLGIMPRDDWIPYAGHLRIEVWRSVEDGQLYAQIAYLNDVFVDIPCDHPFLPRTSPTTSTSRGLCHFVKFSNILKP